MFRFLTTGMAVCFLVLASVGIKAGEGERIILEHADQMEVVREGEKYVTYVVGDVAFRTETGRIFCDSAVWRKGENVILRGKVVVDEEEYKLSADSAFYNVLTKEATAHGEKVELWSYPDSLYAVGPNAYFDRKREYFVMEQRPTLYVNYPDSTRMIKVVADRIEYNTADQRAEASGATHITAQDIETTSECAILDRNKNTLDLYGSPRAKRAHSEVKGELISVSFKDDELEKIDVIDSAQGEFIEPVDSAKDEFDKSLLKGKRIIFFFYNGILREILCYGQAYSWYYPSSRGSNEFHENSVSGDTIRFAVDDDRLRAVKVINGAIGSFVTGEIYASDTAAPPKVDTIDYQSHIIEYNLVDSLITLQRAGHVESGSVSLDAYKILFDTKKRVIEAFSARVDTLQLDSQAVSSDPSGDNSMSLLPNTIPVILRDGNDEIDGDYLEYSIDTEKGRIVQSKSAYEAGFYYGKKLFREQKHIFYVDGGTYTTCDKAEPHYHFFSKSMKLIEGDKLIAKPVVFYLGRIPLMAIPYYVFPLKKGRHSGLLPFTFGRFEKGDRYVRDVGYYWAASEYWDWKGSFDYFEKSRTFTLNNSIQFNKRYVLNGYISSKYTVVTNYDRIVASEGKSKRWYVGAAYNHIVSPSFNISASGSFQSDANYFTDYSSNLDERLRQQVSSRLNFAKKFGKKISLSGYFRHDVDYDKESRTDYLPSLSLSLPLIYPFGSGSRDEDGRLVQKWYQNITFRYTPNLLHFSQRTTPIDTILVTDADTVITVDSVTLEEDTTITILQKDTSYYRSRKQYIKINHNPSIGLPRLTVAKYFIIVPSISYSETWYKIYETDQSLAAGIDAHTTYRTYSWSGAVSLKTNLYGTVYPRIGGLEGLRHVVTPSLTYSYSPEIDRHPTVRSYTGGSAGSAKRSVVNFNLRQVFQAKVAQGEASRSMELLSVNSSFSYNFENKDKPLSNLTTTFNINTLPNISLYGSMSHSFYNPFTGEESFWSPYLMSFTFDATLQLVGRRFLFDDMRAPMPSDDSLSRSSRRSGWNLNVTYSYQESGRGTSFQKSSFVDFNLSFNLTPSTSVVYLQRYDIVGQHTVNNSVRITRKIHCWTGSLWWVPIGSNRGFGFKLNVTALPEIKIDQNYDTFNTGLLSRR